MQRKVDVMNGRVPQATTEKDNKGVTKTEDGVLTKVRSGWQAKDLEQKKWFLYTWLMVLAILVVYTVPHISPAYEAKRFFIGGIVVLLGLHFVIWPYFTEKTSMSTKVVATAVFLFLIAAVLVPNAAVRAMETWDKQVANVDKNAFATSAAGGGESQKEEGMWMLFDPDVYTLARPGDRESIFIDDPETWVQLPEVPDGFEAEVACGSASMKIYWKGGPRYGQEVVCKDLVLRGLEKLTITVSPVTEDGEVISVRLKPIKKNV